MNGRYQAHFSIPLNQPGNEATLIEVTYRHSLSFIIPQIVNKVSSIVQFGIFFILLPSHVPTPNVLCTPCGIIEKYGWTHSLEKLVPNYQGYRHVVTPIRWSYLITGLDCWINDCHMSTGPSFSSESPRTLFFGRSPGCVKNLVWWQN